MAPLAQITTTDTGGDTGRVAFLRTDALGSVRAATNTRGEERVWFGDDTHGYPTWTAGDSKATKFGYVGGYTDPTGLDWRDRARDIGGGIAAGIRDATVGTLTGTAAVFTYEGRQAIVGAWNDGTAENGTWDTAVVWFNPAYGVLDSGSHAIDAAKAGCWSDVGYHSLNTTTSAAETILTAAGAAAATRAATATRTTRKPTTSRKSVIGFAEGLGETALMPQRLQHGTKKLTKAGVLSAWSGKKQHKHHRTYSFLDSRATTAAFDHALVGTRVRGLLGNVDGNQVVVFVYREFPYQGMLASSFVPSANQLKMWGIA